MMWARSTGILIFLAGGIVGAQSANDGVARLESCFEMARIAGEICAKLPNDPALRLDCFQKTRTGQLECLEHALSKVDAATPVPQESGSQPGPPAAAQESRSKEASTKQAGHTDSPTMPAESSLLRGSDGSSTATAQTNPTQQPGTSPPANIPTETSQIVSSPDRSSPPTNAAAFERSAGDASTKQTPTTGSTTTSTSVPPVLPSPSTDAATSEGPSRDASTRPMGDAGSTTMSSESDQLQKDHGPPAATPQTNLTELSSPPAAIVTSEHSSAGVSISQPEGTRAQAAPAENRQLQESSSPLEATPRTKEAPDSAKEILPDRIGDTSSPAAATTSRSPQDSDSVPKTSSHAGLPQRPDANETTGAISPGDHLKPVAKSMRPVSGDWVISETTSPIDYSPLVTALIHSTSQVKDAPNTLTIRCRGQRTELVIRTDGVWRTSRGSEMQGAYQINDQPAVSQRWMLSTDGKSATNKDDVVGLLQALPDGARFTINIADQTGPSHQATFRLDSWDAVRSKIGKACQWSVTADRGSPRRR
jgi:hypothetical protein